VCTTAGTGSVITPKIIPASIPVKLNHWLLFPNISISATISLYLYLHISHFPVNYLRQLHQIILVHSLSCSSAPVTFALCPGPASNTLVLQLLRANPATPVTLVHQQNQLHHLTQQHLVPLHQQNQLHHLILV
jgi:hypothetical protein